MDETKLARGACGSISALLADIAHELSSIQDWPGRIENALCLVTDLLPGSMALFGAECEDWRVFSCEEQHVDVRAPESILAQHFGILTGLEGPSVLTRSSDGYAYHHPIRSVDPSSGSFLSMPAVGGDRVVGVLHVRSDRPNAYSLEDVSLVSVVASQFGAYLANAMAYLREQKNKEQIEHLKLEAEYQVHVLQQALIPTQPQAVEGYDVASAYVPGCEGQEIGGDFFDVFSTEDGKIGILIGDVSGKGIPAASLAATTRSTVHAFAYELRSPCQALTHANSVLSQRDIGQSTLITVLLALLDPESGEISYANAGHPPPAMHQCGRIELLEFGHPPFGVWAKHVYEEAQAHIDPGGRLLFYTDGIIEARHDGMLFGTEGVTRMMCELAHAPGSDMIDRLVRAAREWSNGQLTDDAAVVLIDRRE